MSDPLVDFRNVSKTFAGTKAVDSVSFTIESGEFFSLLGPSGCGKTTTLRLLAGFERPDRDGGEVRLGSRIVNDVPPYERNLGMVFQSYALFPHLDVARNVAFGLQQRKRPKPEIEQRVKKALDLVRLPQDRFGARKPSELSGGQKQRVALARALVLEPPILLLDEPLGALDLKLRREMQQELKALHQQLGVTFVFVTHDQEEALMLSDRVAVMSDAKIAQMGTPHEIYDRPRTRFVAAFLGEANFLSGEIVEATPTRTKVMTQDGAIEVRTAGHAKGTSIEIAVRPEKVHIGVASPDSNRLRVRIRERFFRGESTRVVGVLPSGALVSAVLREQDMRAVPCENGDEVEFSFEPEDARVLESSS